MEKREYGWCGLGILAAMAIAWAALCLTGCAYVQNPATPQASAAVSDECTTATMTIGAVGEFSFVCTHSRTQDGVTTGSVQIAGTKQTVNALGSGIIGVLAGLLVGGGVP